jgi:hypothetical protein
MRFKGLYITATALALVVLPRTESFADQVFVDENFDSYADTSALNAVWRPDAGDGEQPIGLAGEIIPNADTANYPFGINNPPGIIGQGVGNFGSTNEYNGSNFELLPSATQNVVVRGDLYIYDDGGVFPADENDPIYTGGGGLVSFDPAFVGESLHNSRQTIGLRNDKLDRDVAFGIQRGLNFLEMGTWNDSTCDPTVAGCNTDTSLTRAQREANPGFREYSQFAYRITIFGTYGELIENGVNRGPIVATAPNWQYFQFDSALDLATSLLPNGNSGNGDGVVNITDIGSGWHTFQATLQEGIVLLELDLFRDGLNNATGLTGVDASVQIEATYATAPAIPGQGQAGGDAPFTSLRIGGPSGVSSLTEDETQNSPGVFDNIYLALADIPTGNLGDFDLDGDVDGRDFLLWQRNPTIGNLADWQANYGNGSLVAGVTVPEPGSCILFCALVAAIPARLRRTSPRG